jgi:hypothetical protein
MKSVNGITFMLIAIMSTSCGTPANGTVSNYPVHCEGKVDRVGNTCSGRLTYVLNRRTFSVDAQQQRVIEQFENPGALPDHLDNCTVKDVDNWVCHRLLGGSQDTQMMSRWAYNDFGLDLPNDDVVYVSRAQWDRLNDGRVHDEAPAVR